jgi:anthranilate phosphoribosyltransferase
MSTETTNNAPNGTANNAAGFISISPLLKQLAIPESTKTVNAVEIAAAVRLIFDDRISPVQFGLLLYALHTTGRDHDAEVLAATAQGMRAACPQIDRKILGEAVKSRGKAEGGYAGGLVRHVNLQDFRESIFYTDLSMF